MKREPCTPRSCNHVDFVLASMDCERLADYLEFCECDEKHFVYPRVARLLVRSKVSASHVPFTSTDFSLCLQINMSMIEERIRYYRQRIATIVESGGKHTRRPTVTASAHVLFVVVSQRMLLRLETRLRRLELVTAVLKTRSPVAVNDALYLHVPMEPCHHLSRAYKTQYRRNMKLFGCCSEKHHNT